MQTSVRKIVFLCMRMLLGIIFIAASVDKIAHPADFAEIVQNYQILPGNLVNFFSIVLPWLEALIGILILCGWWLPAATVLANLLLAVFLGALASTAVRGIDVHCGCFSTHASGPVHTSWYLARDIVLLLLGVLVMIHTFRSRPENDRRDP
jgi:uncharacterized membrane protein YphA (DoxX/SURF4 family)